MKSWHNNSVKMKALQTESFITIFDTFTNFKPSVSQDLEKKNVHLANRASILQTGRPFSTQGAHLANRVPI